MNETVSIFDISNFIFLLIVAVSWILLNNYNAIFLKFKSNIERIKASKTLLAIAIGSILYAIIWLSVLKNKLSLDDIDILIFLLKISFAILILGIYNFFVSMSVYKKQIIDSNYDIDDDVYDDSDMNSNNNEDKHYEKNKEEEFEHEYDFDNNISDSIDSYNDDD